MAASAALDCPQQPRATYTVRPHGSAYVVVREMTGFDVTPDEERFTSDPIPSATQANAYAYRAAESFMQRYPHFAVAVRPARIGPNTGFPQVVSAHQ